MGVIERKPQLFVPTWRVVDVFERYPPRYDSGSGLPIERMGLEVIGPWTAIEPGDVLVRVHEHDARSEAE